MLVVIKGADPMKRYIKRVIGVPGDTIEVRDDKLYLNGVATDEPVLSWERLRVPGSQSEWQLHAKLHLAQVAGQHSARGKYFVFGG